MEFTPINQQNSCKESNLSFNLFDQINDSSSIISKIADIYNLSKVIFGCCMRKESQHYQIQDFTSSDPAQQCQESTKKFKRLNQINSKKDFLDWLRSLPFEIRYLAVKVEAPGLAQATRDTLRRLEFKNQNSDLKKSSQKVQKNILDSLVFTSDGKQFFDSICFDFSFIEFPERLYQLLMYSGQNTKKFNPVDEMVKNRRPIKESCEQIRCATSRQDVCRILVRTLRHEVFYNTCSKEEIQIRDEKNRKKQLSFYWKNLNEEAKTRMLYLNKSSLKDLASYLDNDRIQVQGQQLQKQIAHLLKLQKNQFCNKIFKCKLKKSLTDITHYHEMVYNLWKQEFQGAKRRKAKKGSTFLQSIRQDRQESTILLQQQQIKFKKQQQKTAPQKYYYRQGQFEHKLSKKQRLLEKFLHSEKQNSIDSFETNETEIYQKVQETVTTKQTFFNQSSMNEFIQKKIFANIIQFSDHISKEANIFYNARLIAFERIKFILQCYGVGIKVFGSCANGIAIKDSDIDIAIDNSIVNYFSYCKEEDQVVFSLQWLEGILSSFPCMKNVKLIKGASVPIIKLTLDTSERFQVDQSFFNFDLAPYLKSLNSQHFASQVEIDLTVETHSQHSKCNHLGINTTKTINQWMQEIKPLKYIIIIMKYFLNIEGLNCTYRDGINTYGLVVMFMAAIRHLKLQKQESIVILFQKILHFFVYEFDERYYGIDLRNKKEVIYRKQTSQKGTCQYGKADLQVLDPENEGKNMTKKCYKFELIKQLFQKIQKKCFYDQRKQIISSFLKEKRLNSVKLQHQSHLKKQCLEEISRSMSNPFISLLKEHQEIVQNKVQERYSQKNEENFLLEEHECLFSSVEGYQLLRTPSIKG